MICTRERSLTHSIRNFHAKAGYSDRLLGQHFSKIQTQPNLFTEGYGFQPKPSWESLARDPSQKVAAIKTYRDEKACGLSEAKAAVESFIASLGKQ